MRLIWCLEKNAYIISYITTENAVAFVSANMDSSILVAWNREKKAKCAATTHILNANTVNANAVRVRCFHTFDAFLRGAHMHSQMRTCLFVSNGFMPTCNFCLKFETKMTCTVSELQAGTFVVYVTSTLQRDKRNWSKRYYILDNKEWARRSL